MIKRLFNFKEFDLIDLQILSFVCGAFIGMLMIGLVITHYFIHNAMVIGIMVVLFFILIIYEFKLIKHLAFKNYIEVEKEDDDVIEHIEIEELGEDKE